MLLYTGVYISAMYNGFQTTIKLKVTKKTENELSLICYVYGISLYMMHLKLSFKK